MTADDVRKSARAAGMAKRNRDFVNGVTDLVDAMDSRLESGDRAVGPKGFRDFFHSVAVMVDTRRKGPDG
ncbi:MAG: hypothetical protein OXD36_01980 [Rhodobacter sp.]|nr:hypothetical protein [Rhodobacter sp.]